jgi:hypothetical protein
VSIVDEACTACQILSRIIGEVLIRQTPTEPTSPRAWERERREEEGAEI